MKKLFVSDVDGTLLKTGKPVHSEIVRAISDYVKHGNFFALSTGRSVQSVAPLLKTIVVNAPCILCSGAIVYDFNKANLLSSRKLDRRVHNLIQQIMSAEPSVSITVYTQNRIYNLRTNQRLLEHGVKEDRIAPLISPDLIYNPVKILFTDDDPERLQHLGRTFIPLDLYDYHSASAHFYELTPVGVSKGTALRALCHILAPDDKIDVYAAGDAQSDLTMLQYASHFFAPITAPDDVKSKAHHLFPSPIDGGLAEILDSL